MAQKTGYGCFRCHQFQPPDSFPLGRKGTRHTLVCWGCVETEAYERDAKRDRHRAKRRTWRDPSSGVMMRRCLDCEKAKQLRRFPKNATEVRGHGYRCYLCARKLTAQIYRERSTDPKSRAAQRAYRAKAARKWRKQNPERYAAQLKRRKQRTEEREAADPSLRVIHLENQRIRYRLKREREGFSVKGASKVTMMHYVGHLLPAAPLAQFVDEKIKRRREAERSLGFDTIHLTSLEDICHDLGIELRSLNAWRRGERQDVQVGVAERFLLNANVDWETIWPPEQFPDVYAKGGALAGGTPVAEYSARLYLARRAA